jgi:DnaD/phage-associated family protein
MPRYRQLHLSILDSPSFSAMPDDGIRVFWMLLPLILDRDGRGYDEPPWIRNRMFPRRDVPISEVERCMDYLARQGMIARYSANGSRYFHIPTWKLYQTGTDREAVSRIPEPPKPQEPIPTNSQPTPEQVPGNTMQYNAIQCNGGGGGIDENAKKVFTAYENEIGMLTPITYGELETLLQDYPADWILAAIKEAVLQNARRLPYVKAILARWKVDGFQAKGRSKGQPQGQPSEPAPPTPDLEEIEATLRETREIEETQENALVKEIFTSGEVGYPSWKIATATGIRDDAIMLRRMKQVGERLGMVIHQEGNLYYARTTEEP